MGDLRPDNHDGSQPDEGRGGLPDFPPEWGEIVIPDDASELDAEAHALRRELRRQAWNRRLRRRRGAHSDEPSLRVPIVIMTVAILTTLVSLFVVTWGRQVVPPEQTASQPATSTETALPDLMLADAAGDPIRLGGFLPAIILLADSCDCTALIRGLATAVPDGMRVLIVGHTARPTKDVPDNVIGLADPRGALTSRYPEGTTGKATALLVSPTGTVLDTVTGADDVNDLPRLDPA